MKSYSKTLASVAILTALTACGGSGGSSSSDISSTVASPVGSIQQTLDPAVGALSSNDAIGIDQSISLKGAPGVSASNDLTISNAAVTVGAQSNHYQFDLADTGGEEIPLENLSIALEVAATGNFADSYRMPLFDFQEASVQSGGNVTLTARSAAADLPTGVYLARLVVNPNWQYGFDSVPSGSADNQPFRYLPERDYLNNASDAFQLGVASPTVCTEEAFEENDTIATATVIPTGGQVNASLCLDNVDIYSVVLAEKEPTSLIFEYTDSRTNPNAATRYIVLDPGFNRTADPMVARDSKTINIAAQSAGEYYIAFYGRRSSYRITRANNQSLPSGPYNDGMNESLFHSQAIAGPNSWLYGDIVLHRLALNDASLKDQVVNCGRITTQFSNEQPVAYVTPQHFAGIHEFRFLSGGGYLVDGERENGWHVQDGDISNADWYRNDYPGYAEQISGNTWRYWTTDGLAYVECTLEVNR